MIQIDVRSHSLGGNKVLENISLDVEKGSVLGLVGTNGAGKSTLLRLMAGIYRPDDGEVRYNGKNVLWRETRKNIFFLSDDPYCPSGQTGKGLLDFYSAVYPSLDTEFLNYALNKFGLDIKAPQRNFSKGMRRQFNIALALSVRPEYLLMDEAFDGIDAFTKRTVVSELISLVESKGTTVVISSHALSELESFCDSYALIDGRTLSGKGSITNRMESFCRFKLAFTEEVTGEKFSKLPVRDIEITGKFVSVTLECNSEYATNALNELEPAVMQEVDITFEDIFISDVKGGRRLENGRN